MNLKDEYRGQSKQHLTPGEQAIVKAADLIDAYLFIKHNHHDRHGAQVFRHMERKLNAYLARTKLKYPTIGEAIENTMSMLEFGRFDVEQTDD